MLCIIDCAKLSIMRGCGKLPKRIKKNGQNIRTIYHVTKVKGSNSTILKCFIFLLLFFSFYNIKQLNNMDVLVFSLNNHKRVLSLKNIEEKHFTWVNSDH